VKFAIYYYGPNRKQRHGADLIGHLEMTGKDYTKLLEAMRDKFDPHGHYQNQKFFSILSPFTYRQETPTTGGWPMLRRVVTKAMKDSIDYTVPEPSATLRGVTSIAFATRKRKRTISFHKGRALYLSIVQV